MPQPPKRPRKHTPAAVKTAPSKGELHPRNRHQGRYDFPALISGLAFIGYLAGAVTYMLMFAA